MHLLLSLAVAGMAVLSTAAPSRSEKRGSKLEFVGVNESGPEFGTALPGKQTYRYNSAPSSETLADCLPVQRDLGRRLYVASFGDN